MTEITDPPKDTPGTLMRVEGADDNTLNGRYRYAKAIAGAGDVIPKALWDHPRDNQGIYLRDNNGGVMPKQPSAGMVLAVTEVARMLGFHPLAGLMGVYIIEGKPSLSAAIMSAKIRTAGHRLRLGVAGNLGDLSLMGWATLTRKDDPDFEYRVEWTLFDAAQAGLGSVAGGKWSSKKDNWDKYPRAMLKARAVAEVIREAAEDELMGAAYLPDELGANTDADGAPIDAPVRAPSRDWAGDIEKLRSLEVAAVLREELRNHADYTPDLWGALMTKVGMLSVTEDVYEADGTSAAPHGQDGAEDVPEPHEGDDVPPDDADPADGRTEPQADEDIIDAEIVTEGDDVDREVAEQFPELTDEQRAGVAATRRKARANTGGTR